MSPKQIAIKLDIAPQTARNNIGFLYQTGHITREGYGKYSIADLGLEVLRRLELQPSNDQSREEK